MVFGCRPSAARPRPTSAAGTPASTCSTARNRRISRVWWSSLRPSLSLTTASVTAPELGVKLPAIPLVIPDQLARLAARLELPIGPTVAETVERLLAELRGRNRWLLLFDNAERPGDVADYRPGGAGHVLITSRYPGWGALGGRL